MRAAIIPVLGLLSTQGVLTVEIKSARDDFAFYWNAPSFVCQKYGINFAPYTAKYGILSNPNDSFRGSVIIILYDPGAYPALLVESTSGKTMERNKGIPQRGNLTYHLELLEGVVDQLVDEDFSGQLVLDEETWRPNWEQNWNNQLVYKTMSQDWVRQRYPQWSEQRITSQAKREFESGAKEFFYTSLALVQAMRPKARVGYYGFPYCYNMRPDNNMSTSCSRQIQMANNRIQWLFDSSSAFYPSIYLSCKLRSQDQVKFVKGRMDESRRLSLRVSDTDPPKVYPYLWYKYYDDSLSFLSQDDLYAAVDTVMRYKLGGLVLWGASADYASQEKCQQVLSYLTTTLGPTIEAVREKHSRTYDSPIDMSELAQVSGPKVIFTAIDKNGTKSIYQFVEADAPQGQVTYHGDRYVYSIDPTTSSYQETTEPSTSRTARSTSRTPPRTSKFMQWYERVLRAMLNLN